MDENLLKSIRKRHHDHINTYYRYVLIIMKLTSIYLSSLTPNPKQRKDYIHDNWNPKQKKKKNIGVVDELRTI